MFRFVGQLAEFDALVVQLLTDTLGTSPAGHQLLDRLTSRGTSLRYGELLDTVASLLDAPAAARTAG